jgi:hypothetical protein
MKFSGYVPCMGRGSANLEGRDHLEDLDEDRMKI